jgi:signal transduction histidine kinase
MKAPRFGDLPLFWKLLVPFLGLMLVVGAAGTFLVVRDLAERAQATLDQDLSRRSLEARTAIHDRELYILESVNLAANLQGMDSAIRDGDTRTVASLLGSVLALKTELDLLVVTDRDGDQLARSTKQANDEVVPNGRWGSLAFVRTVLASTTGERAAGTPGTETGTRLVIVAPVCLEPSPCRPIGTVIAGIKLSILATESLNRNETDAGSGIGVTVFGQDGNRLAVAGVEAPSPPARRSAGTVRTTQDDRATLYRALQIQGRTIGTVAVTIPRAPAFAAVRGAGLRLAFIVLSAMAGIVGLGALLSRFILAQVRPLVETSRALGHGNLAARVALMNDDELGELARGLNQMAEQLQASHETMESRVAQRTEEVHRLLSERTEFFASMSHEFRTPLAVILSEADMLGDTEKSITTRTARETARTIRTSGDQLLSVINEILELAQADAGHIEVDLESVRLGDVVKELRPTILGLSKRSGLSATIEVPRDLPAVIADRTRLREILLNLIDNAVKYTPANGKIVISARETGDVVEVSITDTGVGIPPDVGSRIFDPFFRVKGTKPLRGQASTGLGLALARSFVEAQGGTISFTSEPGRGTTFTFTLQSAGPSATQARVSNFSVPPGR